MVPIKEALTFDDVTLVPQYSEILPSEVDTSIKLTKFLKINLSLTQLKTLNFPENLTGTEENSAKYVIRFVLLHRYGL